MLVADIEYHEASGEPAVLHPRSGFGRTDKTPMSPIAVATRTTLAFQQEPEEVGSILLVHGDRLIDSVGAAVTARVAEADEQIADSLLDNPDRRSSGSKLA